MPSPILWGAFVPGTTDPVPFETAVGKTMSLFHTGQPWARSKTAAGAWNYQPFPTDIFERHRLAGRLLLWDWRPWDANNQMDPAFDLNAMIRGDHDAFIHQWARAAAAWGHEFMLKPYAECNGDWYVYGEAVGANPPGAIVDAWHHVHAIFEAEGAANVTWVECFNIQSADPTKATGKPLAHYYPGDAYVDWIFLDGYNFSSSAGYPWQTFAQVFRGRAAGSSMYQDTYGNATALTNKPIGLAEVSSDTKGGNKPAWITDMLATIPTQFPRLRAVCWTDDNFGGNITWSLTDPLDPTALAAFKAGIASPIYLPAGVWLPEPGKPISAPRTLEEELQDMLRRIAVLELSSGQLQQQQALQTQTLRRILEGKLVGPGGAAADVVALEGGSTSIDVKLPDASRNA